MTGIVAVKSVAPARKGLESGGASLVNDVEGETESLWYELAQACKEVEIREMRIEPTLPGRPGSRIKCQIEHGSGGSW